MRSHSLDTIQFIDTQAALPEIAAALSLEPRLALDSEADSFHHYEEQVCLLQIATPDRTILLDLLRLDHLEPLLPIFADPAVEKILHGADYDVRILGRDYGVKFARLFDTMIAAQLLGREAFGLGALVQSHFSVTLNKRFQKADWTQRPLPSEMIRYAAEDTAYLLPLRDALARELEERDRLSWLREECDRLVTLEAGERAAVSCFAVKGAGRPITPEDERAEILGALACVDGVVIFDQDTPHDVIAALQPTVLVKGADWAADAIVGRDLVEAAGGRVVRIPIEAGHSTSALVEKIRR